MLFRSLTAERCKLNSKVVHSRIISRWWREMVLFTTAVPTLAGCQTPTLLPRKSSGTLPVGPRDPKHRALVLMPEFPASSDQEKRPSAQFKEIILAKLRGESKCSENQRTAAESDGSSRIWSKPGKGERICGRQKMVTGGAANRKWGQT